MTRSPRTIALLLGALVVATAACGSDDDEASSTTAAAVETTAPAASTPAESTPASTPAAGGDFSWTMVTDQAGLGDQGFNDLAFAGIEQAAAELGGTSQAIESKRL